MNVCNMVGYSTNALQINFAHIFASKFNLIGQMDVLPCEIRCYKLFVFPLDNVHFQQAAQISKALVEQQVDFEAMVNIGPGMTNRECMMMGRTTVSSSRLHWL